ncbi:hypothetical protein ON010_g14875 [Phytophthora cinnamomi]|nr:hypothetical protein ON010_g14875 [Phytophthora cinnamomi]
MLLKRWIAAYSTFYTYLSDLGLSTAHSVASYAKTTCAAAAQSRRRAFEGIRVTFLVLKFVLAVGFFAPKTAYDLLEMALLAETGVAIALVLLNIANFVFGWTSLGPPATVLTITVGVVTHVWRCYEVENGLDEYSPAAMIVQGLKDLRTRAAERERSETETLQRLQGEDTIRTPAPFQDATDSVDVVIDDADTSLCAPAAISVDLRAAAERSALLRLELACHPEVRREDDERAVGEDVP